MAGGGVDVMKTEFMQIEASALAAKQEIRLQEIQLPYRRSLDHMLHLQVFE